MPTNFETFLTDAYGKYVMMLILIPLGVFLLAFGFKMRKYAIPALVALAVATILVFLVYLIPGRFAPWTGYFIMGKSADNL
jgi:hypothetical protein